MEFIKAAEFLGQPIEVQKVFVEWWKPSTYDLASNIHGEVQLIGEVMDPNNPNRFKLNNVINNTWESIHLHPELGVVRQ